MLLIVFQIRRLAITLALLHCKFSKIIQQKLYNKKRYNIKEHNNENNK